MSEIALYEVLKQIPNVTDEQAKAAVADIAKKEEVATKSDLDMGLANLEIRLVKQMYSMAGLIVGSIGLMFVIAGFIIKAL